MTSEMKSKKYVSRRDFLKTLSVGAGAAALSACGTAATETAEAPMEEEAEAPEEVIEEAPAPAEPVALVWMFEDLDIQPLVEEFVAANPNIEKIDLVADDDTRFKAMLAAGEPPNLKSISGRTIPWLVRREILLDIEPYLMADDTVNPDNLLPIHNWMRYNGSNIGEGNSYGLVKDWSPDYSSFVDKRVFEEAGLPVPSETDSMTYEEVAALAEQLVVRDGDVTERFGISSLPEYQLERVAQIASEDGGTTLYDEYYSSINLTSNDSAKELLKYWFDLIESRNAPSSMDPSGGWEAQLWSQGKFGILGWVGYWFTGLIRMWAAEDENVQALMDNTIMIPEYTWGSMRVNGSVGPTATAVTTSSENHDQAWEVLKFYIAGIPGQNRATSGWGLPSLKSLIDSIPSDTEFDQQINAGLELAIANAGWVPKVNPYYNSDSFGAIFTAEADKIFNGEITFDDLVQNMENEINQAISDNI